MTPPLPSALALSLSPSSHSLSCGENWFMGGSRKRQDKESWRSSRDGKNKYNDDLTTDAKTGKGENTKFRTIGHSAKEKLLPSLREQIYLDDWLSCRILESSIHQY